MSCISTNTFGQFFSQCHHQDSYEFLGNRKKRLNSIEEEKPNKLMLLLLLGIQDRNDHCKIPQGKRMFDAKKHRWRKNWKMVPNRPIDGLDT